MNGIDSVVIATGNDFRSVEAGIHAYASRNGNYSGLSNAYIKKGFFHFELTIPISIGTVGGLTKLHPLVNWAHNLLGNPTAETLMQIIAAAGLELRRNKIISDNRDSKRTHENAFTKYIEPTVLIKFKKTMLLNILKKYVSYKNVREFLNKK